jgi:hypothetical protein
VTAQRYNGRLITETFYKVLKNPQSKAYISSHFTQDMLERQNYIAEEPNCGFQELWLEKYLTLKGKHTGFFEG